MRVVSMRVLAVGVALMSATTFAGEVSFSGYLSAIGGMVDDEPPVSYAGYQDEDLTFDTDSLVGLQAVASISERLSVTAQLVARGNDNWEVDADWAYVSYQASDSWKIRGGRFRVPFYLYSDFVTVGYAYPWIRPPTENYSLPFDNISGIDAIFTTALGSGDLLLQGYFGSTDFVINAGALAGSSGTSRNQIGLVGEYTISDFKFRLAHHQADVSVDLENFYGSLPAPLQAINPYNPAAPINAFPGNADRLLAEDDPIVFQNAAAQWDNGRFLIIVERNWLDGDDESPNALQNRMYVTAGVRFGEVLLHVTYAERDDEDADLSQGMPTSGPASALTGAVNVLSSLLPQVSEQNTIGLRWDFTPAAAFKIEYLMQEDNKPVGLTKHEVNVLRFGVQTVF